MNILFVDQYAQLGGAQRCLLDLFPAFQQQNWKLRFAVPGDGPFPEQLRNIGIPVDVLPTCSLSSMHKTARESFGYIAWYVNAARDLRELALKFDPDLVYVNGPRLLPPLALFARRNRVPLVYHAHSRILQRSARWFLGAHLRIARPRIVACCRYVAQSLRAYVPPEMIEIVYNGVQNVGKSSPQSGFHRTPTIGVIGRIEREKGQLEFVKAAHIIHREMPSCRFVLVGMPLFGRDDSYLRQIVDEGRGLPLTFTGWQSDVFCALRELDLLVVPSLSFDATPRVVIEAFAAGTPVVAYSCGGIPELIDDAGTGFLVKMHSPEALASRVLEVLRARDGMMLQVAANARRKWEADFRLEHFQQRMCEIISGTARCAGNVAH